MSFRYGAHIGYLFGEMPLQDRIGAAARNGFSAIEHPSPYTVPADTMRDVLAAAGVPYVQFGLRSGNAEAGEKGIGIFANRREEFERSVAEAIAYARTIGVDKLHAMAGVLPKAQHTPGHWDCYVDNLRFAAREAEQHGISIIVEAMSAQAVPHYYIETPDRAVEAIEATGASNIGLLLDIFHTASAGLDIEQTIRQHSKHIFHIHIADVPGRHEPGSGLIDFTSVEAVLEEVGYRGFLGCEYSPSGNTEAGLGWLRSKRT